MDDVRQDKPAVADYLAHEMGDDNDGLPKISWYKPIASHISELYNKYSYGKGYEKLMDPAAEGGHRLCNLRRFSDTRFAQSEKAAYENFVKDYKLLHGALTSDLNNLRQGTEDAAAVSALLDHITSFDWI